MKGPLKRPRPLPPVLRTYLLVLGALSVLCLGVEAICRWVLHLGYPYNWPLMFPDVSFFDFRAYLEQFGTFHTAAFFHQQYLIMYPATVLLCYRFFYSFQPFATIVFLSFIVLSSLTAALLAARALVRRGLAARSSILFVGATYLLAYPFWFEFKQANMEIVIWVVLSLGLWAAMKQRTWTAALLFGLAAACKLYPIIYLGLLLSRKRYRECVFGCLVAGTALLASLWFVGPTTKVAWQGMQAGLAAFRTDFMLVVRPNEIGFDHSLFAVLKTAFALARRAGITSTFSLSALSLRLTCYMAFVSLAGTVLYFFRIRHLPVINQVLCLVVASILLPPVSFDYTVIHLYAPWLLMCFLSLRADQTGGQVPGLKAAFVCLALAVSPLSEFIFHHERFGGEMRSVMLLTLFIIGVRFPFSIEEASERPVIPAHSRGIHEE